MKNQTHQNWLWQGLTTTALFITIGINTAHAKSPFKAEDFVKVSFLADIEVQKNEITCAQYSQLTLPIAHQNPWLAEDCNFKAGIVGGFSPNQNYAAVCLSFNDAEAYIRVLNDEDPSYTYRLPTDAELKTLVDKTLGELQFNGGISGESMSLQLTRHAWYYPRSNDHAHEVCTRELVFGLCDILGNVLEWTSTQADSHHVIRGASWFDGATYLLSAVRLYDRQPEGRNNDVGFRLVRTAAK